MSKLGKKIEEVQPEVLPEEQPSAETWSIPSALGLTILKWNKESWSLPWASFLGAQYLPKVTHEQHDDLEQVQLAFAYQIVTVKGRYLESLIDAITDMHLSVLRELPSDFLEAESDKEEDAEPVIISIDVQARENKS